MATIEDVVKHSGVSRSTVFRFLNGSNVRSDAKNSIINAMKALNYKTDELYKYDNIEIEISISSNFESFQVFSQVVEGITHRAEEKGVKVNIVKRSGQQIKSCYEQWHQTSNAKGVIVVGKNSEDTLLEAEMLNKYNIPHIFINRIIEDKASSYVAVDLYQAAFDMTNYLISEGHNRIAIIACTEQSKIDEVKLAGYKDAFKANDIIVSDSDIYDIPSMDAWEDTVKNLLSQPDLPDAFFAICDSHAIKFVKFAKDVNINIPDDMALAGMDNLELAEYCNPALTTVHVPFLKMGHLAVDDLIHNITDDEVLSKRTILKHKIIKRESC